MDKDKFNLMEGEWIGIGPVVSGPFKGTTDEFLKLERSGTEGLFSYIRRSRIVDDTDPKRVLIHNELGYMGIEWITLLLARNTKTYIELIGKDDSYPYIKTYTQTNGTPDSRNMVRKVEIVSPSEMVWDNQMEVDHGGRGGWVPHTVRTTFKSISR
jgi:hypothetical protein